MRPKDDGREGKAGPSSGDPAGERSGGGSKRTARSRITDDGDLRLGPATDSYTSSFPPSDSTDEASEGGFDWLKDLPPDVRAVVEEELASIEAEEAASKPSRGQPSHRQPSHGQPSHRRRSTPPASKPSDRQEPDPPDVPERKRRAPALDVEGWIARETKKDPVKGMALRVALDDWEHGSYDARQNALATMISVGRSAEPLLMELLAAADPTQTELAFEGLVQLESPGLYQCLWSAVRSSYPDARMAALRSAQRLSSTEAVAVLTEGARDSSPLVRRRVVHWLSWRMDPWAQDLLWELCRDKEPTVRWSALRELLQRNATDMVWRAEKEKESDPARYRLTKALLASAPQAVEGPPVERSKPMSDEQTNALVALARARKPKRDNTMQQTEIDNGEGSSPPDGAIQGVSSATGTKGGV